ncbi:leucine-rich repeat-containing protein 41 [Trematomus bernacchii]|uniref:leucine-rich repeat-containing protein 41 n=1 Tax=Trematomus bernacchii TaxID=40690 RepID=UPI001469D047|nr:leucine-rich repeat-containing protein 41 [Trematomus bernacchii]
MLAMGDTARKADIINPKDACLTLKEICFLAVREHYAALGIEAVIDLPTPLIKGLLLHLTVCQLDELQPALNKRGISTHAGWIGVLQEMRGLNHAINFHTEEEAKHEVMRIIFTLVFYGYTSQFVQKNITHLNTPSFLLAAAKCIKYFSLDTPVESLTSERRHLLKLLEKGIRTVCVSKCMDPSDRKTDLYVLHRLLDHGVAKKVVIDVKCSLMLSWILLNRGSQFVSPELRSLMQRKMATCNLQAYSAIADRASCGLCIKTAASEDQDDHVVPCKRLKLDCVEEKESGKANLDVDLKFLCQTFAPREGPSAGACPWGQIECLEIRKCVSDTFTVLNNALPTCFFLRSLTLHSITSFRDADVLGLAKALKTLTGSCRCSLTELSVSVLPYAGLLEFLLDANPHLTSLHVEIQTAMLGSRLLLRHPGAEDPDMPELPLQKLSVKVAELQLTDLHFITNVLRHSPHLTSLHIAGMRLPTGSSQSLLLSTLSGSNQLLRSLHLEDVKLSDCLPEILNLLRNCKLEELRLNDCRLLERWSNKQESLHQLVCALRTLPSLHTLSLAQNRIAKNVCVLADLFSGPSPSPLKRLNISSNFILPAELLEFSRRLRKHPPPQRLTLDLRKNPGDRDPDTWSSALHRLQPFCVSLVEGWSSSNTMADYISNM